MAAVTDHWQWAACGHPVEAIGGGTGVWVRLRRLASNSAPPASGHPLIACGPVGLQVGNPLKTEDPAARQAGHQTRAGQAAAVVAPSQQEPCWFITADSTWLKSVQHQFSPRMQPWSH